MHKKLWGMAVIIAPLLGGCAFGGGSDSEFPTGGMAYNDMPREPGRSIVQDGGQKPLQCVPYARDHSQVKIYGDAYTWWDQAAQKYQRASTPESGAVLVLSGYAGPDRGHVAVVQKIISTREIRVDHANWLDDGSIYLNDPVADVSADNDWSAVRVFNIQTGAWGGNIYPVKGFILPPGGATQMPDSDDDAPLAPVAAPLTARVQKPVAKPRTAPRPQAAPQESAPQVSAPASPYDLTPEDRELEPESVDNPGPVALAEMPKKTR